MGLKVGRSRNVSMPSMVGVYTSSSSHPLPRSDLVSEGKEEEEEVKEEEVEGEEEEIEGEEEEICVRRKAEIGETERLRNEIILTESEEGGRDSLQRNLSMDQPIGSMERQTSMEVPMRGPSALRNETEISTNADCSVVIEKPAEDGEGNRVIGKDLGGDRKDIEKEKGEEREEENREAKVATDR